MENGNTELIVEGYRFKTEEDAKHARDEIRKVSYIKSKLNYEDPDSVLKIYEKMITGEVFSSPVGYTFLRQTRSFLLDNGINNEEIMSLPPFSSYSLGSERVKEDPKPRIVPAKPKYEYHKRFITSAILNVILILAIAAMFVIMLKSENPNVLNYEFAVQDKYASWEQELTEREKKLRQREKELYEKEAALDNGEGAQAD